MAYFGPLEEEIGRQRRNEKDEAEIGRWEKKLEEDEEFGRRRKKWGRRGKHAIFAEKIARYAG